MPFLSICVPAVPERFDNLRKLLDSLERQTCHDFEVIVCLDGTPIDPDRDKDLLKQFNTQNFETWFTCVERTPNNEHLAHRNHARNTAASVADGSWLFFCDVDMVLDAHWVAHARCAPEKGVWAFSSPIVYLDEFGRPSRHPFGTMNTYYRKSSEAEFVVPAAVNAEGMPCLSRELFYALGQFDERFVGWGGNKVEFIARLNASAAEYVVMTSAQCYHNWHEPAAAVDPSLLAHNNLLVETTKRLIEDDSQWWRQINSKVKELVR